MATKKRIGVEPLGSNRPKPAQTKPARGSQVAPNLELEAFTCPHCHVYSRQDWTTVLQALHQKLKDGDELVRYSICDHCERPSLWVGSRIVYPSSSTAPLPSDDMPLDPMRDFDEARDIAARSPRGAAALLRLVLQKICKELGEPGKSINDDIASLVVKGLPIEVKEAMDSVRIIGNEAVHPGQLDIRDDAETANRLFSLINYVTQRMIGEPKRIKELHERLPAEKRHAIKRRDNKA